MNTTLSHLESTTRSTLAACKKRLQEHYATKMDALVLYGSAARQQLQADSDLYLLVLLKPPFDYCQELYAIVDLLYPLQLESSHWISPKPADQEAFMHQKTQLYRNIKREGIRL